MQYRYTGPHPAVDENSELVHPGDVRDMSEPPAWGPWEPVPHVSGDLPEAIVAPPDLTPPGKPPAATPAKGTEGGM